MPKLALHWFRRDLRLCDNTALHHAARDAGSVLPVFVLSQWTQTHGWTGPARQQFLCGSLESLDQNLRSIGSRLTVRCGQTVDELERLVEETGADSIYTNRDPDPHGKAIESAVHAMCQRRGIAFHSFKDCVLHEPNEALTGEGQPYRVYTPFSKNWLALPKLAPLPKVTSLGQPMALSSLPLPTLAHWGLTSAPTLLPVPGERAARARLKYFLESGTLARYGQLRNIPAGAHSSQLSQDLRFGLLGIRELYHRCQQFAEANTEATTQQSVLTYVKELAWREFYMAVLHHWPQVLETEFNEAFRHVPWESRDELFAAWKEGRTGFPIVDAGMRQLLATGWMHNRVRMITAMFLTKDLHVHWRLGESYFMQHLVDGEIASNNGGWQWSAGTGADAAPYFRIQNPWTQTKSYDPEGAYIKHWLPELKHVPAERLREPPKLRLAPDYPMPIVNHHEERERTLARFKLGKNP
ncbi:MAG: cryptochrome/photolyase family protein [Roseimicrobium sp.]